MPGEHFLDAAIIIGRILSWDAQHASVMAYFRRADLPRHTSAHIERSVRNTFLSIGRAFREYTVQLDREINGFDTMRVQDELRRHLASYVDSRVRAGRVPPNLGGQVRRIAQLLENKFRNACFGTGRAEDAAYEVDVAIKKALNDLAIICQAAPGARVRVHACPHNVQSSYSPVHACILSIMGGHADDALVAIEAFHINKTIAPAMVVLVTTDRAHFIGNKAALDAALAPIQVAHPDQA